MTKIDPIAATMASAVKRAESGLTDLDAALVHLTNAVRACDALRDGSTIGEYPTRIAHPIQWDIEKLFSVVRSKLHRQAEANKPDAS